MKHLKSAIALALIIIMGVSSPMSAKEDKTEKLRA